MRVVWQRVSFALLVLGVIAYIVSLHIWCRHTSDTDFYDDVEERIVHDDRYTDINSDVRSVEDWARGAWSRRHVSGDVKNVSIPTDLPHCPRQPPHLLGKLVADEVQRELADLQAEWGQELGAGGDYSPKDCLPAERTAIIIPCRNRWAHLRILLNHLIPLLLRQQLSFTIFVMESNVEEVFNKGILFNAGVREALRRDNYTCFVFHDVDVLSLNDRALYRCGPRPTHIAVALDKFDFKLPYLFYFGGVSSLTRDQVENVNGFSNLYFGWGSEDDDLCFRMVSQRIGKPFGLHHIDRALHRRVIPDWCLGALKAWSMYHTVSRLSPRKARFHMIEHFRDKGNEEGQKRLTLAEREYAVERMAEDGLKQAVYHVNQTIHTPLFTWVRVTVNRTEVMLVSGSGRAGARIAHVPEEQ